MAVNKIKMWNIPVACTRASADFMISSSLLNEEYERILLDYDARRKEPLRNYES